MAPTWAARPSKVMVSLQRGAQITKSHFSAFSAEKSDPIPIITSKIPEISSHRDPDGPQVPPRGLQMAPRGASESPFRPLLSYFFRHCRALLPTTASDQVPVPKIDPKATKIIRFRTETDTKSKKLVAAVVFGITSPSLQHLLSDLLRYD